ncbi:MAG: helix-turn-helix transcriptional regulator [Ruminococcaceae bacterium]|nr:helix-turn-helix transcriptional regulator [Oscillospiraceae bacterium]
MNDVKSIVAKNIATLRQKKGLTQLELAERLNYSDKAISKWERAESMPDISVLVELAGLFEVSMDFLILGKEPTSEKEQQTVYRHSIISAVSVMLVWLIAVLSFVLTTILFPKMNGHWLAFVYAVPISMIVWLVFNSIWFQPRLNYLIVSLLMWTCLASIHLTALMLGANIWLVYILGIPGQLIISLWSVMRKRK